FSTKWKVKFSVISHQLSVLSSALKIGAKCFVFSERFSTFVAPIFIALRVSQSDMTTQFVSFLVLLVTCHSSPVTRHCSWRRSPRGRLPRAPRAAETLPRLYRQPPERFGGGGRPRKLPPGGHDSRSS